MTAVLDAWAIVAYLKNEPAAPRVEDLIRKGSAVASDVNVGEVLYSLTRTHGPKRAEDLVRAVRPSLRCERPDWALVRTAGQIKAGNRLSYADAFVVATAQRHSAPLYTGDPEIVALGDLVEVIDLRKESE